MLTVMAFTGCQNRLLLLNLPGGQTPKQEPKSRISQGAKTDYYSILTGGQTPKPEPNHYAKSCWGSRNGFKMSRKQGPTEQGGSFPGGVLPEGGRAYSGNPKAKSKMKDNLVIGYFQANQS
jgi:hypothetical protein